MSSPPSSSRLKHAALLLKLGFTLPKQGYAILAFVLAGAKFAHERLAWDWPPVVALVELPILSNMGLAEWGFLAAILVVLTLVEGSFRRFQALDGELDLAQTKIRDLEEARPLVEGITLEQWPDQRGKLCLLVIRNLGAAATFNAKITFDIPKQSGAWTGEWGSGGSAYGKPQVRIASGDTARLALARVSGEGIDGASIAVWGLEDGGQRIYAWSSSGDAANPGGCTVDVEIYSEPAMLVPVRRRLQIDRYNFRDVGN